MISSEYSDYYDLYYADKDYKAEVDFVLELAARCGSKAQMQARKFKTNNLIV